MSEGTITAARAKFESRNERSDEGEVVREGEDVVSAAEGMNASAVQGINGTDI